MPGISKDNIWYCLTVVGILALGVFLRFFNIAALGPFVDEGANVLPALDPEMLFHIDPATLGRPGLEYLFAPVLVLKKLLPEVAVLTLARSLTAATGVTTAVLLALSVCRLSGRVSALVVLGLWCLLPHVVIHDRLALQDPFTSFFYASALYLLVEARALSGCSRVVGFFSCLLWAFAGCMLGLAFLNKFTAILGLPWLFALLWCCNRESARSSKVVRETGKGAWFFVMPLGLLAGFSFILSLSLPKIALSMERLASFGHRVQAPSLTSMNSLVSLCAESILGSLIWFKFYLEYNGAVLIVLVAVALLMVAWRREKKELFFALLLLLYLFFNGVIYSGYKYARYLHTDLIPIVVFLSLAYGSSLRAFSENAARKSTFVYRVVLLALLVWASVFWLSVDLSVAANWRDNLLVKRSAKYLNDYRQYVDSRFDGTGVKLIFADLQKAAKGAEGQQRITVFAANEYLADFYGLRLMAMDSESIQVVDLPYKAEECSAILEGLKVPKMGSSFILFSESYQPKGMAIAGEEFNFGGLSGPVVRTYKDLYPGETFWLGEIRAANLEVVKNRLSYSTQIWPDGWTGPKHRLTLGVEAPCSKVRVSAFETLGGEDVRSVRVFSQGRELGRVSSQDLLDGVELAPEEPLLPGKHEFEIESDYWISKKDPFVQSYLYRNNYRMLSLKGLKIDCLQ